MLEKLARVIVIVVLLALVASVSVEASNVGAMLPNVVSFEYKKREVNVHIRIDKALIGYDSITTTPLDKGIIVQMTIDGLVEDEIKDFEPFIFSGAAKSNDETELTTMGFSQSFGFNTPFSLPSGSLGMAPIINIGVRAKGADRKYFKPLPCVSIRTHKDDVVISRPYFVEEGQPGMNGNGLGERFDAIEANQAEILRAIDSHKVAIKQLQDDRANQGSVQASSSTAPAQGICTIIWCNPDGSQYQGRIHVACSDEVYSGWLMSGVTTYSGTALDGQSHWMDWYVSPGKVFRSSHIRKSGQLHKYNVQTGREMK